MDFNSILTGTSDTVRSGATFAANLAYQTLSLAGQGISSGASVINQGVSYGAGAINQGTLWAGRQVTTLGPVLTSAARNAAGQLSKLASAVGALVSQAFAGLTTVGKQACVAGTLFVEASITLAKAHPLVSSGATGAVTAVALTLLLQRMFAKPAQA